MRATRRDSCTGDSGGPLARNVGTAGAPEWRLVGLVSFGSHPLRRRRARRRLHRGRGARHPRVHRDRPGARRGRHADHGSHPPTDTMTPIVTPTPTPLPVPVPTDTVAPVATVTRRPARERAASWTCASSTPACRAGCAGSTAVVTTYRTRCRRGGRRVACRGRAASARRASRRPLPARDLGAARRPHRVAVRALDEAGNRQIVATRRTLRTPATR